MTALREIDPYAELLGIGEASRPPNHYALLGLPTFEVDAERIRVAALRRVAHLRKRQTGPHADLTQRLLNEVAAAKLVLLDETKRTDYDADLRARDFAFVARGSSAERIDDSSPASNAQRAVLVAALAFAALIVAFAGVVVWRQSQSSTDLAQTTAEPVANSLAGPGAAPAASAATAAPIPLPQAKLPSADAKPKPSTNAPVKAAETALTKPKAKSEAIVPPPPARAAKQMPDAKPMPESLEPPATVAPPPRPPELVKMADEKTKAKPGEKSKAKPAPAVKKPVPEPAPIAGTLLDGPVDRWLMLGPLPGKQVAGADDLRALLPQTFFVRQPPTVGETEALLGKWQVGVPNRPGVYLLVLPVRLEKFAAVRLAIHSTPGGAIVWVNRELNEFAVGADEPQTAAANRSVVTKSFLLPSGRHKIIVALNVVDPKIPFVLEFYQGKTDAPLKTIETLIEP